MIIKMRGGKHSQEIREYEITPAGLTILDGRLTDYRSLITGIPEWVDRSIQKGKS
jgi:circadian clock protein KaiC